MLVTEIKDLDKKKKLIYIDYEPEFALYNSEVRRFQILEDSEIEPGDLEEIYKLLYLRCKTRVSYLLAKADKTEHDLTQNLRRSHYPAVIVEKVVSEYVQKGYIDDAEYARCYIKNHMEQKSLTRLTQLLMNKGISKDTIAEAVHEIEEESFCGEIASKQKELIRKELNRRKLDFDNLDRNARNKAIASLMRKGFRYEDIAFVLSQMKVDERFDNF